MNMNVNQVLVTTSEGSSRGLSEYKGNVLLIVNVASRCGFTKQYTGLQALQDKYGAQGLRVLGFHATILGDKNQAHWTKSKNSVHRLTVQNSKFLERYMQKGIQPSHIQPLIKVILQAKLSGTSRNSS